MSHMDLSELRAKHPRPANIFPTPAEFELLQGVPEAMREPVLMVWRYYAKKEEWVSESEKRKAMEAFYFGLSILTRKD